MEAEERRRCLEPTRFIDSDHADVIAQARRLTEVRRLWGDRTLPRYSLGETYLDGRWLKLDATIDARTAAAKGRPYEREFDGEHDIPTVEGPILEDLESHADCPVAGGA